MQSTLLNHKTSTTGYRIHLGRKAKQKEKTYIGVSDPNDSDDLEMPSKKKAKKNNGDDNVDNSKPSKTTNSQTIDEHEISLISDDEEMKKELPSILKDTKKRTQSTIGNFAAAMKKPIKALTEYFSKSDSQPSTRFH